MIISGDRIITGDGAAPIEMGALLLKEGNIQETGTFKELTEKYREEEVHSYPGCTLLPGLIDMHTHIGYYYDMPEEYGENQMLRALWIQKRMEETIRAGVTTIRDVASADNIGITLKKARQRKYISAPAVYTSLKGICMTGGHGSGMTGAVTEADGAEEIRKAVRSNIKGGADWIKVLTSEGFRGVEYSQEELDTLVDETHRLGRKAAAHAGYGPSIEMCIRAGCDTIEHGTYLTGEQAIRMRERNQVWVPTIYAFFYVDSMLSGGNSMDETLMENRRYVSEAVRRYKESFRMLYDTGVCIAAGTDTDCLGVSEASPVAKECACMTECGITPLEAITCATYNGAKALGLGDELGLLKQGYRADLLVVRGNPAEDIAALEQVAAVYQEGEGRYESESAYICP